jgi:hypothetical protein
MLKNIIFSFLVLFSSLSAAANLSLFPYVGFDMSVRSSDFPPHRGKSLFNRPNFTPSIAAGVNFTHCLGLEASYHKSSPSKVDHFVFHVLGYLPLCDLTNKLYAGIGFSVIKPYNKCFSASPVAPSVTAGWYHGFNEQLGLRIHGDSKFINALRNDKPIIKSIGVGAGLVYNF